MRMSKYGITRAHLRLGSQGEGGGNGDDHFQDMAGSHHFVIYITPQRKTKGYAELKALAGAQDCHVQRVENDPLLPGKDYLALKITKPAKGSPIPEEVLRAAHRWVHKRNFLHSFFRPYAGTEGRT